MTGAKDRATYVALKAAGFPVKRKEGKAVVDYVICLKANAAGTKCEQQPPAAKFLQPDDVIVADVLHSSPYVIGLCIGSGGDRQ